MATSVLLAKIAAAAVASAFARICHVWHIWIDVILQRSELLAHKLYACQARLCSLTLMAKYRRHRPPYSSCNKRLQNSCWRATQTISLWRAANIYISNPFKAKLKQSNTRKPVALPISWHRARMLVGILCSSLLLSLSPIWGRKKNWLAKTFCCNSIA